MIAASVHLIPHRPPNHHRSIFRPRRRPVLCTAERQALFSRIAPVYDSLNDVLSLGQHRIWKRQERETRCWICVVEAGIWRFSCLRKLVPMARWVEGNALELPFSDCYFDAITMGYGLRNVINFHKAMEEMYRVLKPSSKVSILDFNKSTDTFSASIQEWMIDNVVVPVANGYGLAEEYKYLKSSIQDFLTGKELEELALEVGFTNSKHFEIGGGLMGNLVATR
ncbi:2-phytyl-1,4-beta-naphthoquinone methyltransferase, chloroplastic isoform X4 [Rhododendron vialii]|uniref:2-phytyl-1,4-beta-naphthoquinone methyltransferase, chloroplastic isoform X4 n=1 Tax=Rhododendron vialii TaxID=182163 RepID=UPI00265E792E|nr:2-phytyl-1,4-beta-naphthoquinone methyltransferase, chloroplastic isoform X4 [Rhododendron vialii]